MVFEVVEDVKATPHETDVSLHHDGAVVLPPRPRSRHYRRHVRGAATIDATSEEPPLSAPRPRSRHYRRHLRGAASLLEVRHPNRYRLLTNFLCHPVLCCALVVPEKNEAIYAMLCL